MENLKDNAGQLRVQLANSSTAVLLLAVTQMVETLIQVKAAAIHWTVYTWQV